MSRKTGDRGLSKFVKTIIDIASKPQIIRTWSRKTKTWFVKGQLSDQVKIKDAVQTNKISTKEYKKIKK